MNKAIVTAIAIAPIFTFLIQTSLAMPGPKISVEPPYLQVSPGEEFTVNITIYPEEEIYGVQYELYFNNALLNATSLTQGTFFGSVNTMTFREEINNTAGKIEYGEAVIGDEGVNNPGVLAFITFKVIGTSDVSNLNLSNVIIIGDGGQIFPDVYNGTFVIGTTSTPTPTPTPTSGSEDDGNGDASVTSTPTPTSTPTQTPSPTPTSTSGSGDNGNGNISITPTPTSSLTPTPTSTETAGLTPTLTPTINHVPLLSPSPSLTAVISPTPAPSMPLSEENNRLPGFEAVFATAGLLVIASYLILKRKERR